MLLVTTTHAMLVGVALGGLVQPSEITNACPATKNTYMDHCTTADGTCGGADNSMLPATVYDDLAWQSMANRHTAVHDYTPDYPTDPLAVLNYVHSSDFTPPNASACAYGYTAVCVPHFMLDAALIYPEWGPPFDQPEYAAVFLTTMDENNAMMGYFNSMKYPGSESILFLSRTWNVWTLVGQKFDAHGGVVPDRPQCSTVVCEIGPEHGEFTLWVKRKCFDVAPVVGGDVYTNSSYYKFLGDRFELAYRMAFKYGVTPEMYASTYYKRRTPETQGSISHQAPIPPFGGLSDLLCDDCTLCTNKCRFSAATNATYRTWQVPYLWQGR
jgi:hypothetical protein